jgi:hypothetical protein
MSSDPLTRGPNQVQTLVDVALAVFTLNQLDAAPSYKSSFVESAVAPHWITRTKNGGPVSV